MKQTGLIVAAWTLVWAAGLGIDALNGRPLYVLQNPPAGAQPVYRFWSPAGQCHFYTISERERDKLIEQYADRWTYEGPAFYAWPVPPEPNQ